jgi:hypothetical protein
LLSLARPMQFVLRLEDIGRGFELVRNLRPGSSSCARSDRQWVSRARSAVVNEPGITLCGSSRAGRQGKFKVKVALPCLAFCYIVAGENEMQSQGAPIALNRFASAGGRGLRAGTIASLSLSGAFDPARTMWLTGRCIHSVPSLPPGSKWLAQSTNIGSVESSGGWGTAAIKIREVIHCQDSAHARSTSEKSRPRRVR